MNRSEHNLMIGNNPNKSIGFSFMADMKATACILRLLPNCTVTYMINNDGDQIYPINWNYPANRSLEAVNWNRVKDALDEYLVIDEQQQWVIERKNLIFNMIQHILNGASASRDIMDFLSKENLQTIIFK